MFPLEKTFVAVNHQISFQRSTLSARNLSAVPTTLLGFSKMPRIDSEHDVAG